MAKTPGSPPETTATSPPVGRLRQRRLARGELLAVVGGGAHLVRPQFQPVEIGPVAEEIARLGDRAPRLRRDLIRPAGPEADDGQPRRSWPSAPSPAPAPARNRAPRRPACRPAASRRVVRPWCRARHRRRASSLPAAASARRILRQVAADLHDHGGVGVGQPARQLELRSSCPAARSARRRPARSAAPACDQQPDMAVTPGMTSVGKRCASRTCRCM